MTTIVNVSVANIRPQYNNLKEWMADQQNVYIGRGSVVFVDGKRYPYESSQFCNPFKISKADSRDDVIKKFKEYIHKKLDSDDKFKNMLTELKGKRLGCWCKPQKCHGDILIDIIDKMNE